jgi:quercetin dioxygenase-like cupin family protein
MPSRLRALPLAFLLALSPALAQTPPALPDGFAIVKPEDVNWATVPNSHGVQTATLHGNPSKPGLYVIRVRFPPHVMDMPHFHSTDRHVTVISGTWAAGTGPDFDPAKATRLKAGSYMFHPADGVHWDGAATDEDAVVQIIGIGHVATTQSHGAGPDWVEVK